MRHSRLASRRGITLLESILYVGVASWVFLLVSKYFVLPLRSSTMLATVNTEQTSYSSTAGMVNDLKSAVSTSLQWTLIDPSQPNPPYDPAVNPGIVPWFQVNDPAIAPPNPQISYVCYAYKAAKQTIVREFISGHAPTASPTTGCAPVTLDGAVETIVARNPIAPTAQTPMFSPDYAATNMVMITLQFPGVDGKPITVVRRVHMRT